MTYAIFNVPHISPADMQRHYVQSETSRIEKIVAEAMFKESLFPFFLSSHHEKVTNILLNGISIRDQLGNYFYNHLPSRTREKAIKSVISNNIDHIDIISLEGLLSLNKEDAYQLNPYKYFTELHEEWCLSKTDTLLSLWAIDIYSRLKTIERNTKLSLVIDNMSYFKSEFTWIIFSCAFIQKEKEIDMSSFNLETAVGPAPTAVSRFNSDDISLIVASKLSDIESKLNALKDEITKATNNAMKAINNGLIDIENSTSIEECNKCLMDLQHISKALHLSKRFFTDLYSYRYFHELRLEQLLPPRSKKIDLPKACEQLNLFSEMIHAGWKTGYDRRAIAAIPNRFLSPIKAINVESLDKQSIKQWTGQLIAEVFNASEQYSRVLSFGKKIIMGDFILETAVQGDKVMQDLESKSLSMGKYSQKVKATPNKRDDGSRFINNSGFSSPFMPFDSDLDFDKKWIQYSVAKGLSDLSRIFAIYEETIEPSV